MTPQYKVCVVAPVHEWDDVRVFHKQAITLAKYGYNVVLLAQASHARQSGGVTVKPVRVPRSPRTARFCKLPLVFVQALRERADLYHLHNPDTLPLALGLKAFGKTVVYDTHEDFAERILIREWVPIRLRRVLAGAVALLEKAVAAAVDASIGTQQAVVKRLGSQAVMIGNAPRVDRRLQEDVAALAADISDDFDGMRVIHIGSISMSRGLLDMVDGIELANRQIDVRLWMIGPGETATIEAARARPGWRYIDYLERQPQEQAFAYVKHSDVGLIAFRDLGDHRHSDPNKIYEYLAFGVPFIASDFPAWRKRLRGYDAGWFFAPGDSETLAAALIAAAQDPASIQEKGLRGRQFVGQYNWENESRRLLAVYSTCLNKKAIHQDSGR